MLKKNFLACNIVALLAVGAGLVTSCIRAEQPNINMDVKDIAQVKVSGKGIIKTTVQENSVTMYADMSVCDVKNIDSLKVSVSPNATWSYIDVKITSTPYNYYVIDPETGDTTAVYPMTRQDTTVLNEIPAPTDFSVTRYIKVTSEAEGVNEDDIATQKVIDSQKSLFIGWENNKQLSKTYTPGAHLFKIWAIKVLPAGFPTSLTFDRWASVVGSSYQQPFEMVKKGNEDVRSDIWSSTNASIALMEKSLPIVLYGARPTDDVAVAGDGKKALLLTSNDIRFSSTWARPFLAGCCFIGEFDGSDTGALTCTHVGLPFNKRPESISFWYKYLPMTILDPNRSEDFCYTEKKFNVPDIAGYVGQEDKGFIRAVLYRADGSGKRDGFLDGATIRDLTDSRVVAYVEFAPKKMENYYHVENLKFTYLKSITDEDLKNWKYNLALYFASSYDGFRFIAGANMNSQLYRYSVLAAKYKAKQISYQEFQEGIAPLKQEQMGSQLYIDEMEINCAE